MTVPLTISIFSDIVCPWCYIGKRRMEKAVDMGDGNFDVQADWLAFELNPQMPGEGLPRKEYLTKKFGSLEKLHGLDAQVAAAAEGEGIPFDLSRIEVTPNTFDAHRMVWVARRQGCQDEVVENLFSAYFCEGRDIGDRQVLLHIARDSGLGDINEKDLFEGEDSLRAVTEEKDLASALGIQSVPSFLINQKYLVSGAHPPETLYSLLDQAQKKLEMGG